MPLSWNEIRQNAINFQREWDLPDEQLPAEHQEKQTFWDEFFQIFGRRRKELASFEEAVHNLKGNWSFIDLFWPRKLIVEHKSPGGDLDKASSQAFDYFRALIDEGRSSELPRYIILCDFKRFVIYDLEPEDELNLPLFQGHRYDEASFELGQLHANLKHFAFLAGYRELRIAPEDPANFRATEIMAGIHDALKAGGYHGHHLERLLVRILFILFAEDTGIFQPRQFEMFLENHTAGDGSNLGSQLASLFQTLDTPTDQRQPHLLEDLAEFPYVNGALFQENIRIAHFDKALRAKLLEAAKFDWSKISPAIFGSLFQGIMQPEERRQIGAHYTSERDILKLIRPLFLDALQAEFRQIAADRSTRRLNRLKDFQGKLATLTFFDPACGCGNFLVIAYRELRLLELETLKLIRKDAESQMGMDLGEEGKLSQVDVHQFHGIEIEEWPALIAEVALWLMDHQMNSEFSLTFGNDFTRIPLSKSAHIVNANALELDWNEVLPARQCSYIIGNPPFIGAKYQTAAQREELRRIFRGVKNAGLLDYVTAWYAKALRYTEPKPAVQCAFVSTNSISQGEQVAVLWSHLFQLGARINFAHRTFSWQSEAKGKAHVHVVIIGFGRITAEKKWIYEYDDINGEPQAKEVLNITPYLSEGGDIVIANRSRPLCDVPEIGIGNKPIDGGHYLFTREEKEAFTAAEPASTPLFRPWIGSREFLQGLERWCLWLGDTPPHVLKNLPLCRERIAAVRELRLASSSTPTQKLADTPTRFHVENFPKGKFMVLPKVSSERRPYIPFGHMSPPAMCSDLVFIIPNATPYHFGILSSRMHIAWVRTVCGRLKSDYRYSAKLVYNNFPWPQDPGKLHEARIGEAAEKVLEARQPLLDAGSTLADLYDPLYMPAALLKAHQSLDRAVEKAYRGKKFTSDRERVEHLFDLYARLTAPALPEENKAKMRRKR